MPSLYRFFVIRASFLLLVAVSFSACSPYLKHFKTAQTAFNQGAEAENLQKLNPAAPISVSPESNYRMAHAFIVKAMGNEQTKYDKSDLAKDGLLLNAYTIKALSEWKLGLYQQAIATSEASKLSFGNNESVKTQRDYVVMMSLKALVYNDSVERYIRSVDAKEERKELTEESQTAIANLQQAYKILAEQRMQLSEDHPVQSYLLISQLSVAKNIKTLVGKLQRQLRKGRSPAYETTYKPLLEGYRADINKQLPVVFADFARVLGSDKHPLYLTWKKAHADVQ